MLSGRLNGPHTSVKSAYYQTRNTEDGTVEHWHYTETLTLVEQRNTDRTIEIPQSSRTGEHLRNNGTAKQYQYRMKTY